MAFALSDRMDAPRTRYGIVIPVHDGLPQLVHCLDALRWAVDDSIAVIVVDAASSDGSSEAVAEGLPEAVILQVGGDLWWTASVGVGCRYAVESLGCDRIFLLNHDCDWDLESFRALNGCLDRHPGTIVCSRVVGADGRLHSAGGEVLWTGMLWLRGQERVARRRFAEGRVAWCGGQGVGFTRETYLTSGRFDYRRFPHYYGDADWCLRASRHGVGVWYCPDSRVVVDTTSTGFEIPREGSDLRSLWMSLASRKSVTNLPDTVRFYRRHMGPRALTALIHVYTRWGAIAAVRWSRRLRRRWRH